MLNYDKMDEVLNNLDKYANEVKSVSETQEKLDNTISKIDQTISNLNETKGTITSSAKTLENIENVHNKIEEDIVTVLQNYKKTNSAFEYLELELKNIRASLDSIKEEQAKVFEKIENSIKKNAESQNESIKSASNMSVGLFIVVIALLIINLLV